MANLKIVKGANEKEQIKSIDGLLNSMDKKLEIRKPDKKLAEDIANIKQTLNVLMEFLGLIIEAGPNKVIRQVRKIDAFNSDNS